MMTAAPWPASALAMPSPMPEVDPVTRAVLPLRCMRGPFFIEGRGSGKVDGFGSQLLGLDREAFRSALGNALGQQVTVLHRRFDRRAAERPVRLHRRAREFEIACAGLPAGRSEEHTSELQSLMRISYAVFCLKKKTSTYPTASPAPSYITPDSHSQHHIY